MEQQINFDEMIPRRDTNSVKWDSAADAEVLPMWVADMDFRTAPAITEALRQRVEHGIFGYTRVPDAYYEAVVNWFARRHGWQMQQEWILYTISVVPALSATIKALTEPGDKVLMQTPVYNCFFSAIRNNGCEIADNRLIYENNTYRIDFEDLERKASDDKVKLMLLCNPHNPAGRVWTREELTRIGEICLRHGVIVVSDEIHCEFAYPGHAYTPFASISDDFLHCSVTCVSPSKAFNIAGLQIANIVCANEAVRHRINEVINLHEINNVNPFGVIATIAAYNEGESWLLQLLDYLRGNYECMRDYCAEHLPDNYNPNYYRYYNADYDQFDIYGDAYEAAFEEGYNEAYPDEGGASEDWLAGYADGFAAGRVDFAAGDEYGDGYNDMWDCRDYNFDEYNTAFEEGYADALKTPAEKGAEDGAAMAQWEIEHDYAWAETDDFYWYEGYATQEEKDEYDEAFGDAYYSAIGY